MLKMALFNPVIGDIPQPQKDRENVFNPLIPNPNYKANVYTPLINEIFAETLETLDTQTDTYDTTEEIILTQIIIQGLMESGTNPVDGTVDIYINEVKVFSNDLAGIPSQDTIIPQTQVTLENVRIPSNSRFKMESVNTNAATSNLYMNCSFIGYKKNKQ